MKLIIKTIVIFNFIFINISYGQGPVIISGLDTEYGIRPGSPSHGSISMWANVIQTTILNCVTNNSSGPILVIGGGKGAYGVDHMTSFWNDIGTTLSRSIVYSNQFTADIPSVNIIGGGWAMIAVCNTYDGVGKLNSLELNQVSTRQSEIATFINNGGGLFASSCNLAPVYGYINIGSPAITSINFISGCNNSVSTAAGTTMGLNTIQGPFHNYFTSYPSFLNVLATCGGRDVILGGCSVTVPNVACCPGDNLVINGDFESGNTGFTNDFMFQNSIGVSSIVPGQYGILNGGQAAAISPTWSSIQDETTCSNTSGNFLIVNGENGGGNIPPPLSNSIPSTKIIWEQNFNVLDWRGYKFCFDAKKLDQCGFNIIPKIEVQFSMPFGNITETISSTSGACDWQRISKHLDLWGYGTSLNIKIVLDQNLFGDGNDIALDNIQLILLDKCPNNTTEFDITTQTPHPSNPLFYSVTAIADIVSPCESVWWEVCKIDIITGDCISSTKLNGMWWSPSINFNGYDGTSIWTGTSLPGFFEKGFFYKLTRGTWGECNSWNASSKYIGVPLKSAKIKIYSEKDFKEIKPKLGKEFLKNK